MRPRKIKLEFFPLPLVEAAKVIPELIELTCSLN